MQDNIFFIKMHIIYKRMSTYIDLNKYQKLGKIYHIFFSDLYLGIPISTDMKFSKWLIDYFTRL